MPPFEKSYRPGETEERWYREWEESGAFTAPERADGDTFSVVIPPPNVTGILHIGHALNTTLQDILVRWERMRGRTRGFLEHGRALKQALPPDASIVLSAVGAVGYASELRVHDRNGLVERHPKGRSRRGKLPGHDHTYGIPRRVASTQLCGVGRRRHIHHLQAAQLVGDVGVPSVHGCAQGVLGRAGVKAHL